MEKERDKLRKTLHRYVKGTYLQEDVDFLIECSHDPDLQKEIEAFMDQTWLQTSDTATTPEMEQIYSLQAKDLFHDISTKPRKISIRSIFKYAAIVTLLSLSVVLAYSIKQKSDLNNIIYTELQIEYGQTQKITLPDGTSVMLNAGSKIKYPNKFITDSRLIELDGEGFFQVTKNPDKPFIIKLSNDLSIKVLGTSFNVKGYAEDESMVVTVKSGLVQVDIPDATLKLRADEQLNYNNINKEHHKQQENSQRAIAWINGRLYFNQTSIADVAQELKRTYNKKIELDKNSTFDDHIYGEHENQSLESVLRSIYYSTNIKYRKEGETIIMYKD